METLYDSRGTVVLIYAAATVSDKAAQNLNRRNMMLGVQKNKKIWLRNHLYSSRLTYIGGYRYLKFLLGRNVRRPVKDDYARSVVSDGVILHHSKRFTGSERLRTVTKTYVHEILSESVRKRISHEIIKISDFVIVIDPDKFNGHPCLPQFRYLSDYTWLYSGWLPTRRVQKCVLSSHCAFYLSKTLLCRHSPYPIAPSVYVPIEVERFVTFMLRTPIQITQRREKILQLSYVSITAIFK